MDYISGITSLAENVGTAYGDYKTGKAVRLGQYKGAENLKQIGHYNSQGKRLGIYHG